MKYNWIRDLYFYELIEGFRVGEMLIRYSRDKKTPKVILIPGPDYEYYKIQEFVDGLKSGKLIQ